MNELNDREPLTRGEVKETKYYKEVILPEMQSTFPSLDKLTEKEKYAIF